MISPFWAILVPVVGAALVALPGEQQDGIRNPIAILVTILTFALVAPALPLILGGGTLAFTLLQVSPALSVSFKLDSFGILFATLSSFLWIFAAVYASGYMSHESQRRRFFTFYILALSAAMGIAFSANLFTFYIFYEYLALLTYPLVIHNQSAEAYASGMKYIVYTIISGVMILFVLLSLAGSAGTLDFSSNGIVGGLLASDTTKLTLIFFVGLVGFGVKAAFMPLHSWLPAAMVAPTPVSALLHAVAVVKSGIFGVFRFMFFVFGADALAQLNVNVIVAFLAAFTIIVASLQAIKQDKLKSRLAYSTIAHLSYIILGAAMLNQTGLTGGAVHIINHAFLKIVLFFCAGIVISQTGVENISEMAGISKRLPLTMGAFAIGAVGLMGVPGLPGFISKLYLLRGALDAGQLLLAGIILGGAILSAIYYLPIVISAFFQEGNFEPPAANGEAPMTMLAPVLILVGLCFLFGILPNLTTLPIVLEFVSTVL